MKKFTLTLLLIIVLVAAGDNYVAAQPNPGQNSGGSSVSGGPIGGTAPLGSGLILLLGLAAVYAGKKIQETRTDKPEED